MYNISWDALFDFMSHALACRAFCCLWSIFSSGSGSHDLAPYSVRGALRELCRSHKVMKTWFVHHFSLDGNHIQIICRALSVMSNRSRYLPSKHRNSSIALQITPQNPSSTTTPNQQSTPQGQTTRRPKSMGRCHSRHKRCITGQKYRYYRSNTCRCIL